MSATKVQIKRKGPNRKEDELADKSTDSLENWNFQKENFRYTTLNQHERTNQEWITMLKRLKKRC